jgi:hypothetical protein
MVLKNGFRKKKIMVRINEMKMSRFGSVIVKAERFINADSEVIDRINIMKYRRE